MIGAGFRGVDRGGRLGGGVVDQVTEIVGEAGENADFGGHDISIVQLGAVATYTSELWR